MVKISEGTDIPEARGEPARPANKIEPGHIPAKMKIRKNLISLKPTLEKGFLEHQTKGKKLLSP